MYLFSATTNHVNKFKSLFELLFHNMMPVCFVIDARGFHFKTPTSQNVVINVHCPADKFTSFEFNANEPIHMGLGLHINHFFKTAKTMSEAKFFITDQDLNIVFSPGKQIEKKIFDDHCVTTMSTKIETIQNVGMACENECEETTPSCRIMPVNFSKLCRSMKQHYVDVTYKNGTLEFNSTVDAIFSKKTRFGTYDSSNLTLVHQQHAVDHFVRVMKIASLARDHITVYMNPDRPMTLYCESEIGTIHIYLTSEVNGI